MPAPASIAGRPQSAEATPRRTSGGVRPACIQAWMHAAVMSSTPQSSQPVRIACPVLTAGTDDVERAASDWSGTRSRVYDYFRSFRNARLTGSLGIALNATPRRTC